jgi:hypothetical protein
MVHQNLKKQFNKERYSIQTNINSNFDIETNPKVVVILFYKSSIRNEKNKFFKQLDINNL